MTSTEIVEEENHSSNKDEGNIVETTLASQNNSPKTTGIEEVDRAETPININILSPIHVYDPSSSALLNYNNNINHSSITNARGGEGEELQQIRKSIEAIQGDLRTLSTTSLSETVVRNLQLFLLQQDNNQTYISRNDKYNYLRNLEHLLKNMKRLEEARQDEITSLRTTYEEKLSLLEQELQRKDSLIEVLTRVSDEKDKVIESLHLYNGARVVTPRELREIKQEISNLKRQLPETTETLSTIKKDRKKASSTDTLQGKRSVFNSYNLKEKKDQKELKDSQVKDSIAVKDLKDVKDFKDLKEYVLNPNRSRNVHPLTGRKESTNTSSAFPIVHSLERLPNITKRTK
ncbi:predicted protein [Naegleria gruberi]|uniref:Predicted protein n=1 Tax=Naegleria gruberi TaxID=5762 RepID=D2V9K6_NAEGR|nr:uncharacterized protein NAEGRDRAFT_47718 [Naegleria gruberi]EFC46605.1 predicted protein [Naegleria gruberi]|eukprot:XP_002679349.1 predicted protein [Naegleria gruberi strain NEG-M]